MSTGLDESLGHRARDEAPQGVGDVSVAGLGVGGPFNCRRAAVAAELRPVRVLAAAGRASPPDHASSLRAECWKRQFDSASGMID